jgi:hypothetical protein
MLLEQVLDAVPAIIGPRARPGRPRKRPARLHADKGYDYPKCRRVLRCRGITPGSPDAGSSPASGWAATAGRWSGAWRGCWAAAGCRSATSAAPTCWRVCCTWLAC